MVHYQRIKNVEKRVAITPEIIKKYLSLGSEIYLSQNYATHLGISDKEYQDLGVKIISNENEILNNSDLIVQLDILSKRRKFPLLKENQSLIGVFDPYRNKEKLDNLIKRKINVFL